MIELFRAPLSSPFWAGCIVALFGFATVYGLIPLIIHRLAPLLMGGRDRDLHQTHKSPVPRYGGMALALVFALVAPVTLFFLAPDAKELPVRVTITLSALAMFCLGIWDDIRPLGAKKKLLFQIVIAVVAFYCGLKMDRLRNPVTGTLYTLGWMEMPATVFWLVALTNLINLVDGIDGLAGGISLMLMCLLGYVGLAGHTYSYFVAMGLVGALLAFLFFNFPPARIYLGDGGAYFLGYLIAALTIQNSNKGTVAAALIAPVFALALPILDVAFSILRRGLQGLPIFRPDRRHIHHRLIQSGLSRKKAVLTLYGLSLLFLAIAFIAFWSNGRLIPILFGCVFLVLLIAAPSLGIIRNWLTIGTALGNSLEMRKEVQYALLLRNWLEMEAERCESVEELCSDLQFIARKLGFAELSIESGGQSRRWRSSDFMDASPMQSAQHELQVDGRPVILNLRAPSKGMDDRRFQLMAELVAEAWLHASRRWREVHTEPFSFAPAETVKTDETVAAAGAAGSTLGL